MSRLLPRGFRLVEVAGRLVASQDMTRTDVLGADGVVTTLRDPAQRLYLETREGERAVTIDGAGVPARHGHEIRVLLLQKAGKSAAVRAENLSLGEAWRVRRLPHRLTGTRIVPTVFALVALYVLAVIAPWTKAWFIALAVFLPLAGFAVARWRRVARLNRAIDAYWS